MALPPLPNLLSESSGRRRSAPKFTPEQRESILSQVLGGVASGLEWVGESIGKPARTVRALLYDESGAFDPGSAKLSDLAHLVPFSDTFGWTDPDDVIRESDLRERWGWTADTGNVYLNAGLNLATDVGIGVAHDPLTLITGPGKALTKLGIEALEQGSRVGKVAGFADEIAQAGKNAMLGTSPARYADEIRAGQRGLIGLKLPFAEHPFATFGAGSETAAKAADILNYSPLSPVPYVRQLFDKRVGGHAPRYQRELGDLVHSKTLETSAAIVDKSLAIDKRLGELDDMFNHTIKTWLKDNPDVAKEITGGVPIDNMTTNAFVRALAELKSGPASMRTAVDAAIENAREAARKIFADKSLSVQVGQQVANPNRLARVPNVTIVGEEHISNALAAFDEVAQAAIQTKDDVFRFYTSLGGDVTALDDEFIAHFPRRLSELMAAQMGKGKANRAAKDVWGAIQRNIRDIDGGTYKVNAMSRDVNVTGWWDATDPALRQAKLQQAEQILAQQYGLPTAKPVLKNGQPVIQNGQPVTENVAAEFAGYLARLPADVVNEGLFSRSLTTDMMDYSLNMMRRANGLQAVHGMTLAAASDDVTLGPTVKELFDDLKVNDTGVQHFINEYAAKAGLNPANVDPTALYVPEAARKAAERMLHYNSKPQDLIGPVKLIDNVLGLHKAGLYAPWIASHTRNAISGLWQNLVTAFRNPADAVFGIREAQAAMKGAGNREWLEAFKAYALHSGLQIDDWLEVAKAQASDIPTGIGSTLLSAGKDYTWGTVKNVGSTVKNVASTAKSLVTPGQTLKTVKETVSKLTSSDNFREAIAEFGPFKGGRKLGDLVEFVNRYSHFVALKRRGWTNAAAARSVKLAHFDYSPQALTPFENQFMKRLVPFYRFARGNLPLQLRSLIDEPGGRAAQTIRAINLGREQAREEGGYVPSYLSEGLAVPFGPTVNGMRTYGVSSEVLPVEEAFNRFPFFGGTPDAKLTAENLGAMVNPLLSTPLQLMSGRQWWSHRDIDDLYQDPTSDQNLNFLLANTPAARGLSTSRMLQDPRKTALQKIINATLGGARFTTVDIPKWMNIEAREILERNLEPAAGVLEGQYLFAPDPTQLTEEQIIQLSILQALNAENRKLNKERKAREGR